MTSGPVLIVANFEQFAEYGHDGRQYDFVGLVMDEEQMPGKEQRKITKVMKCYGKNGSDKNYGIQGWASGAKDRTVGQHSGIVLILL